MKKYILILVALITSLGVYAQYREHGDVQSVECKRSGGYYYSKILLQNNRLLFSKLPNKYTPSLKNVLDFDASFSKAEEISESEYSSIDATPFQIEVVHQNDTRVIFADNPDIDDDEIVAIKTRDKAVNTSAGLGVGADYELLQVQAAKDPALVGCPIVCNVLESRKSNASGAEGRLIIRPLYIKTKDGSKVRLEHDDIYKRGLNRSNVKAWTCWTIVMLFVPGTRAEITDYDEFVLRLDK